MPKSSQRPVVDRAHLYARINFHDGGKMYIPTVRGKHRRVAYRRAEDAAQHSQRVQDRFWRLKRAGEALARKEQVTNG